VIRPDARRLGDEVSRWSTSGASDRLPAGQYGHLRLLCHTVFTMLFATLAVVELWYAFP
jgi:hypothetical protein